MGNMVPEYIAITENNAIKSSMGPIDVNDCITACFSDILFMIKTGISIYYKIFSYIKKLIKHLSMMILILYSMCCQVFLYLYSSYMWTMIFLQFRYYANLGF